MMNNLRRLVIPTLRNGSKALSQRSTMMATSPLSSSALLAQGPATTSRASFHTCRVLSNAADKPTEAFLTEEMISAMEYHHEQRDVTDLNLFLKHPSSPKIMAWHPDLIFDGDTIDFIMSHDEIEESLPEEDAMSVVSEPETPSRTKLSFLNRNARFGKSLLLSLF